MSEGLVLTLDYLAGVRRDIDRANGIEDDCYDAALRVVDAAPDLIAAAEQLPVLLAETRRLREALREALPWLLDMQAWGESEYPDQTEPAERMRALLARIDAELGGEA